MLNYDQKKSFSLRNPGLAGGFMKATTSSGGGTLKRLEAIAQEGWGELYNCKKKSET